MITIIDIAEELSCFDEWAKHDSESQHQTGQLVFESVEKVGYCEPENVYLAREWKLGRRFSIKRANTGQYCFWCSRF